MSLWDDLDTVPYLYDAALSQYHTRQAWRAGLNQGVSSGIPTRTVERFFPQEPVSFTFQKDVRFKMARSFKK